MQEPGPIRFVDVRKTRGTFLVRTASRAWYTIEATGNERASITIEGGSRNRPRKQVTIDRGVIENDMIMTFSDGRDGNSRPVHHIFETTGMTPDEVEQFKSSFDERHVPHSR